MPAERAGDSFSSRVPWFLVFSCVRFLLDWIDRTILDYATSDVTLPSYQNQWAESVGLAWGGCHGIRGRNVWYARAQFAHLIVYSSRLMRGRDSSIGSLIHEIRDVPYMYMYAAQVRPSQVDSNLGPGCPGCKTKIIKRKRKRKLRWRRIIK